MLATKSKDPDHARRNHGASGNSLHTNPVVIPKRSEESAFSADFAGFNFGDRDDYVLVLPANITHPLRRAENSNQLLRKGWA